MSCYITFGGYRNRKRLARSVIEWFVADRKLHRFQTFVHVIDRNLKREGMFGCIHSIDQLSRPRFFEIEMCNQQSDESYMTTLIHELVHFEQRLRGKWKQEWKKEQVQNKWCSKIVPPDTKYWNEPWEIEAHKLEEEYYEKYNLYNYMKYKESINGR
tara:strand:+ start:540 stop:1010 length:471 start_codon:yes stop_codon:yes gene_type:complete